ncbi:MAG: hypothetical protein INF12_14700 [Methylobacterium sp.]|nr:hypothetical protein [Methylobacterium sp.]
MTPDTDPDWYARYRREVEAARTDNGYVEVAHVKEYWRDDVKKMDFMRETVTRARPYREAAPDKNDYVRAFIRLSDAIRETQ